MARPDPIKPISAVRGAPSVRLIADRVETLRRVKKQRCPTNQEVVDSVTGPDVSIEQLQNQVAGLLAQVANLEEALSRSRIISAAVGIVMATRHVDYDAAFEVLVRVSQDSHRKVYEIAQRVLYTGDPGSAT